MVCIVGKFPVWMTQKPRKGDFGELKSKKNSRGSMPQTYIEVGNRSVFILDPRLAWLRIAPGAPGWEFGVVQSPLTV